jgi:6-carboxyhexanoate--CoA ligase
MGITKATAKLLSKRLGRIGLNNDTVKEALILASKAHLHPMLLGELCISDDPSYTTGYVVGGRSFFITGGEVKDLIKYLQKTPVLMNSVKTCKGVVSLKEFLERRPRR